MPIDLAIQNKEIHFSHMDIEDLQNYYHDVARMVRRQIGDMEPLTSFKIANLPENSTFEVPKNVYTYIVPNTLHRIQPSQPFFKGIQPNNKLMLPS